MAMSEEQENTLFDANSSCGIDWLACVLCVPTGIAIAGYSIPTVVPAFARDGFPWGMLDVTGPILGASVGITLAALGVLASVQHTRITSAGIWHGMLRKRLIPWEEIDSFEEYIGPRGFSLAFTFHLRDGGARLVEFGPRTLRGHVKSLIERKMKEART